MTLASVTNRATIGPNRLPTTPNGPRMVSTNPTLKITLERALAIMESSDENYEHVDKDDLYGCCILFLGLLKALVPIGALAQVEAADVEYVIPPTPPVEGGYKSSS